ncbi:Mini-ribonuclease 3 [Vulcanibacillus modesticaldus]|uniref:Mini-ribonuclease 3 n=1 Tax=Vulcanibacillus modesticaldus TaxID=337097 RepID=A0A1D2YRZ1_9BACI|nr:Mini-ribonuclease 3 [Vulcanibacillus modesticaldus]OEF96398.1 Mini-ribonuclease 3 [Vulcanibacillus modesticaldus]
MIKVNQRESKKKPEEMNALALAYMGDAIYEVYIREYVLSKGSNKPNILHQNTKKYVSAVAQAKILQNILPMLTEKEKDIVKRGRNAKSYSSPKNTSIIDYRYSTGFETLLGFLFLTNEQERLEQIIESAINYIEGNQNGD